MREWKKDDEKYEGREVKFSSGLRGEGEGRGAERATGKNTRGRWRRWGARRVNSLKEGPGDRNAELFGVEEYGARRSEAPGGGWAQSA